MYWKTWLAGWRYKRTEKGSAMVEYALLLALIALVCFVAILLFGEEMSQKYDSMAENIEYLP